MAVPNMDVFEAYFKRADLDGDARISVGEGVSFFQGSNLPQQVPCASPGNNFTVMSLEILSDTHPLVLFIGCQPGIQEDAATWGEDWDKFESEGFSNELTVDVKSAPGQKERASADDSLTPDSLSNGYGKSGIFTSEHVLEGESAYNQSVDEMARSPQGSRAGRSASESSSQDFSDVSTKRIEADIDTHRSFDESIWGAFDTNDDVDSVWGFNPTGNKDSSENERGFFGSNDFGLNSKASKNRIHIPCAYYSEK